MTTEPNDRVGIRELRQNLTRYLRRVIAGETLRITDRNKPVALLTPLPERASPIERLVAEGRLLAGHGDLTAIGAAPEPPAGELTLSQILAQGRRD